MYSDSEFRAALLRISMIRELLTFCVIAKGYRVPPYLSQSFALTEYAEEMIRHMTRRRIPYNEARLICLLELAWTDLLIDVQATDQRELECAIDKQIREQSIYFPFIFGRDLYDRAFEALDIKDGSYRLNLQESLKLLNGTPQGVFQVHNIVTGPFGLMESEEIRYFPPTRDVPLAHCSDVNCRKVHFVYLATSDSAPINKYRRVAVDILKRESDNPSAWGAFLGSLFNEEMKPSQDNLGDPLIPVLGDCFTHLELRNISQWLLDQTQGRLRKTCSKHDMRGRAEDITERLNRSQLMQLCLTVSNRDIGLAIDALVHDGIISVPATEIREPRINVISYGRYNLMAQVGSKGVRTISRSMRLAPLRLRRLIENMYDLSSPQDRQELEWQLRNEESGTLEAKLDSYLATHSPTVIVQTLVLARRSNALTACEFLGLRIEMANDVDFVSHIMWKLGFTSPIGGDSTKDFWRLHEELDRIVRLGASSPTITIAEQLRGVAANYFVALENLLSDSLSFVTWALTSDHIASKRPYIYLAEEDRRVSFGKLDEIAKRFGDHILEYNERTSLFALCRGFQLLSRELEEMLAREASYLRPSASLPRWMKEQDLQRFPFLHTVPFLDLTVSSQENIVNSLQHISKSLVANDVANARNSWLHGGRDAADFSQMRSTLDVIRSTVQTIEDVGFSRVFYTSTTHTTDVYGRSVIEFESPRGFEHSLSAPSPYDWLRMPSAGTLHVMKIARFAEPACVLRFRSRSSSAYVDLWSDFPKRHPSSQRANQGLDQNSNDSDSWAFPGDENPTGQAIA